MGKFLTNELHCNLIGEKLWELEKPLVYESDLIGLVVVPAGFQTDFASVPRVPIAYWFWGGRSHRESVLHDYLYRIDSNPIVSYSTANRVFLEAMEDRNKSKLVRWPMYAGVCIGGFTSYHKKKVNHKF